MPKNMKIKMKHVKIEKDKKANVQEVPNEDLRDYLKSGYKNYGQWKKAQKENEDKSK